MKFDKGTLYYLTDPDLVAVSEGFNVRQDLDLKTLRKSVERYGIRQPLVCHKNNDKDQPFELQDGHRRLAVLRELAEKGADVRFPIILVDDATEVDATVDLAIASMQRKPLNPMEESDLIARLAESDEGNSNTQIGHVIGRSGAHVGQYRKLQNLSPRCQKALRSGKLGKDLALTLAREEDDHSAQDKRLAKILKAEETKAAATKAIKGVTGKTKKAKEAKKAKAKERKEAQKEARRAAGGSTRPTKKELTNLAGIYELRWGLAVDDDGNKLYEAQIEILTTALYFAAGDITEDDLYRCMAQYLDQVDESGEFAAQWSDIQGEYEAEQEAERAAEKVAKDEAKAKAKTKKASNGKPPAAPSKPKAKAKAKKKTKGGKAKKKSRPTASA